MGTVYIVEYENSRVMRWLKGTKSGSVIVNGRGTGNGTAELWYPHDLAFDQDGNLYVADTVNQRVQMFVIDKRSCAAGQF
ncbi:unnamed protein product [Rotaria sp. Silwood2]|nr:unnamed protein product [Rotaria sp. Silwood2]CAF2927241.1 unnamed protein product [Rotaria sp. Silwood2]CAF3273748.1 unnamed protein product [Rotaria sp. Silwood2]CAF3310099.1 unnamed protein product [Rotaria sp. Silwood2]CAF4250980.1 unnamed protein product [Rotaria sp. Silwood2]